MSNVTTGDMARITRSEIYPECVGWIVEVGRPWSDGHWWISHAPLGPYSYTMTACPDAWLRRIENPGDDVVDESTAWLPPVLTRELA